MEKKRKRSVVGRILVFLLALMAIIGLVAMVLSVLNGYINPEHFIWTTVFGLAFWEIFFFNTVVLFLLVILWSKWAWVAVLSLLISIPGLGRSYSFGSKNENEDGIKVMSYNLHGFRHVDGVTDKENFALQVMNLVREKSPDIVCCQEFTIFKSKLTRPQCIEKFAKGIELPYIYYNRKSNYAGNVIFSKFPLTKVSEDTGFGKENTYGVMVEVDAGEKGHFYLANVHLLSYTITDDEIDILTSSSEMPNKLDTIGKSVLHKLSYAFQRRSKEMKEVLEGMPVVDEPVLVCGDFNEPPLSYNYHQMQKAGFVDTFTKVGRGIKPTYAGKLPLMRIDYIWANDKVILYNFERFRVKASDHYPIMLDFAIQ